MRENLRFNDFLADMGLLRFQIDDVPVGSDNPRSLDEAALHVAADLQISEQEELRIVAGFRVIERRAQELPRLRGADQMWCDLYAWPSPMLVHHCRRNSSMESGLGHQEPHYTRGSMTRSARCITIQC